VTSKLPPHDLNAEAAVAAAALIDDRTIDTVSGYLEPEHFYTEAHRRIYEACLALRRDRKPVDVVTVSSWLNERQRIAQVGGLAYLTELLNAVPTLSNVEHYAKVVFDTARIRTLIRVCQQAEAEAYGDYGDVQEFIKGVEDAVCDLALRGEPEKIERNLDVLKRIVAKVREADAKARDAGGASTGISGIATGLLEYDLLTAGLHSKQLTIIGARPGMGKTALAGQIADAVAERGIGVLFFSLEMSQEEILERSLSRIAEVDSGLMRGGGLDRADWTRLTGAAQKLATLPIWIDETPGINIQQVRARALKQLPEATRLKAPLGLIIIDYLQWLSPIPSMRDSLPRDQIAASSKGAKMLAKELGIPVIALAALNREVDKSGKVRWPKISDLRDCGNIESDADNIAFIHREARIEMENEVMEDDGKALIILAKQRGGKRCGTVPVWFDGQFYRFRDRVDP
jgi:replicative DNA helicase